MAMAMEALVVGVPAAQLLLLRPSFGNSRTRRCLAGIEKLLDYRGPCFLDSWH